MERFPHSIAWGLAVVCCACSPAPTAPLPAPGIPPNNLLARGPDHLLSEPGELLPHREHQWGDATFGPWEEWTTVDAPGSNGRLAVPSKGPRAGVILEIIEARDRELGFEVAAATGTPAGSLVEVLLNDIKAGEFELTGRLETTSIPAPAVLWKPGKNTLELHCSTDTDARFLLGAVRYGAGSSVEVDTTAGKLTLDAGTSAEYLVHLRGPSRLELAGEWRGEARLTVELTPSQGEGDPAGAAFLDTFDSDEASTLEASAALPSGLTGEATLRLKLAGAGEASLTLDTLELDGSNSGSAPPVILIVIDTLSARNMSLYGYSRPTTPVLESMAEESVTFDAVYTNSSWTLPSFQSMLSGLYPISHKPDTSYIEGRPAELWERHQLARHRTTLAESFRAAGWGTFAHFDNPWLTETFGIQQGYEKFSSKASEILPPDRSGGIEMVSEDFLTWLDAGSGQGPFFATLHSFDVHAPYAAPASWVEKMAKVPSSIEVPERVLGGGLVFARGAVPLYVEPDLDEAEQVHAPSILDAYDGGIAEVDHKLGLLFEQLKQRDLYDRSLIAVTADHGETMIDGDSFFNHGVSDASSIHIPLLIKMPGGQGGGRRVSTPVQLVDLAPTLLEAAGLELVKGRYHGRSLVPALNGEDIEQRPILTTEGNLDHAALRLGDHRLVVHDLRKGHPAARMTMPGLNSDWMKTHFPEVFGHPLTAARFEEVKERFGGEVPLMRWLKENLPPNKFELFHSEVDMYESRDLWPADPALRTRMLEALGAELQRAESDRAAPEDVSANPGMSEETIEALRAAGYLED